MPFTVDCGEGKHQWCPGHGDTTFLIPQEDGNRFTCSCYCHAPTVHTRIIEKEVSVLPEDDERYPLEVTRVVYRGDDRYAVTRKRWFLNRDGGWERETSDSRMDEEYIARTRYPYEEASRLAVRVARGEFDQGPLTQPPAK